MNEDDPILPVAIFMLVMLGLAVVCSLLFG